MTFVVVVVVVVEERLQERVGVLSRLSTALVPHLCCFRVEASMHRWLCRYFANSLQPQITHNQHSRLDFGHAGNIIYRSMLFMHA